MKPSSNRVVPTLSAVLVIVFFMGVAPPARASFNLAGETTSVLESYDDPSGEQALPFYQYLRLTFTETGEKAGQRFTLYGRLGTDLNDRVEAESRLYFAYYEKKGLWPGSDLRIGRQWINTVAGSPIVDGILLTTTLKGFAKAGIFGGGYVTFEDEDKSASVFGFSLAQDFFPGADFSLSYMQKRVGGDLAREFLGGEASVEVPWNGRAYGEIQYDLLSRLAAYYLAGWRASPTGKLTLKAEYLGSTPVFDATDIYSVFAVDDYREASLTADYRLRPEWILFGGYTREFYKEADDAGVFTAGFELRRAGALHGYLAGVLRTGDEDLKGVKASVGGPVFYGIAADAGVEYNVYTRLGDTRNDTSAKRYWLEGRRELVKDLSLAAKVERIESVVYKYYNRGRVALTYRF